MSDSTSVIQPYADAWLGFLEQVNVIVDTAISDDADGKWGSDAWIRLVHNLIDASIRSYALLVQASLDGPSALSGLKSPGRPRPSRPIDAGPATTYPRRLHTSGLTRVGQPGSKLSPEHIQFLPTVLPAGETTFRVGLTDYNYVGSNYTGTIELYAADAAPGSQPEKQIQATIGL